MKTYTLSIVGCGGGGRLSMRGAAVSSRFQLAAVADKRPSACTEVAELFPAVETFSSHSEMFAQRPTDVVAVSTWPPSHKEIALAALELPLTGIVVEKPLSHRWSEGCELLEAVKSRNLPMATPHNLLVSAHVHEIIDRVRQGDIGELQLVEVQCTRWDIINAGIHWLNFFVTLTAGDSVECVLAAADASTRTYRDGMQVETVAVTYLETRNGVRCAMQTGDEVNISRSGKPTLFRLVGDQGQIEFWAWESAYRIQNAQRPNGELIEVPPAQPSGHQAQLENLAAQMDAGQPDYTIPESSLAALELCQAAYVSARHHCAVTLPLAEFTPPPASDWQPGEPYSGRGGGRDGRKL